METTPQKTVNRPAEESPVAWFVELERARRDSDFERAAQAQRELKRLGVVVKYQSGKAARRG